MCKEVIQTINKSVFAPNEKVHIEIAIDNSQSRNDVLEVNCTLYNEMRLSDQAHHKYDDTVDGAGGSPYHHKRKLME